MVIIDVPYEEGGAGGRQTFKSYPPVPTLIFESPATTRPIFFHRSTQSDTLPIREMTMDSSTLSSSVTCASGLGDSSPAIRHNVVLFGESGVGKSSVVNMLLGDSATPAGVSGDARGFTLDSTPHDGEINGHLFRIWDTAGLDEGEGGAVPETKALLSLYRLLCSLDGGVSLLVFCMRGPRITAAAKKNWSLFQDIICQQKVPAVIAITYLENEDIDGWWGRNQPHFNDSGLIPDKGLRELDSTDQLLQCDEGVACVTATKGKQDVFNNIYDMSCKKLKKLVYESHLDDPWKIERIQWFRVAVKSAIDAEWLCGLHFITRTEKEPGEATLKLMATWGERWEKEAVFVAKMLDKSLNSKGKKPFFRRWRQAGIV
ncbi:hypothetical protein DFP72DRAFT_912649 [Ephemerocybe angulata]|uniref:G domain-containing protein n=1 Tax=Ephemerocybe angulata TaxID=980116 RepID=A0A8H6M319_9AGAR|nr:hypothetical protein DFP72DRAFT_912649 [Tulosesus angulatus]